MSFYPEFDPLNFNELIGAFQSPPFDGDDYAYIYYSEVAYLIVSKGGQGGMDFLRAHLESDDPKRLRAVLRALAPVLLNEPALKLKLISLLRSEHPLLVMEAIDSLAWQGDRSILEVVVALHKHSSAYVRGAVLRYVRALFPQRALPLLI